MHLYPTKRVEGDSYVHMDFMDAPDSTNLDPIVGLSETDFNESSDAISYHHPHDDSISLDTRRLQTQHNVEGYRDGISAGKVESIQGGFDEGFNLGAIIGLKIGRIIGLIEGVATALKEAGCYSSTHIYHLLSTAEEELSINRVFSEVYWASDGCWKYQVNKSSSDVEILFEDVADEHPIISKWEEVIKQEIMKWGLDENLSILGSDASSLEGEEPSARSQDVPRPAVHW
ncbi:hypothetical protein F4805DRAFT_471825 [Annulohypoxylon moriforme]|nr:hypothetical protein F4805DRAFT_471825 [Annulohypoxylon moriforme]